MTIIHGKVASDRRANQIALALAELIPRDKTVLDVGCGNGKLARLLFEMRPDLEIVGIDVKVAPNPAIPITTYDGNSIPFDSQSWDICLASDVLHHCTEPIAVMREMKRVARESIVIKDHFSEGFISRSLLSLMDWIGNYGYGTDVPFNFMSSAQWNQAYSDLGLIPQAQETKLRLYPFPFTLVLDHKLHFIVMLGITKTPTTTS